MSPQLSAVLPLSGWEDFYVIVGSSAAALTGPTFIVERHAHKYRYRSLDSPRHVSEARGEGKE
jgi:hypothetical protein